MLRVIRCRHEWPEKAGFILDRKNGTGDYVFLHFKNPVELLCAGRKVSLPTDACIIYSPGTPHWFHSEQPLIHDWIHFDGQADEMLSRFGLMPDTVYAPDDGVTITKLVQQLEMETCSERRYSAEMSDAILTELFIHISRDIVRGSAGKPLKPDLYDAFKNLRIEVFSSLAENWTIPLMASRVHLSESRFYVLYKQIFGISPTNDIINARIDKAKTLLAEGRYTNAELSSLIGYRNEYHFIRQFRKAVGTTPKTYAKKIAGVMQTAEKVR